MKILFFDGYCNLCNGLVDWVMKQDRRQTIQFASLQGKTAAEKLNLSSSKIDFDTVIYFKDQQTFERSNAILELLNDLGGFWRLFYIFKVIPVFMRDFIYNWVAKNRFRFFGSRETCRMPTPNEKARLLD